MHPPYEIPAKENPQHPPTQWNLRGMSSSVEYNINKIMKNVTKIPLFEKKELMQILTSMYSSERSLTPPLTAQFCGP